MTAISIVEIIGVLRIGVDSATVFIVVPLIACNAFQILMLHRILKPADRIKAGANSANHEPRTLAFRKRGFLL